MLRNIATLALAVAVVIAAIVGAHIYAEKGRIAQNEASKAADEKATQEMALKQEKLEAERVANELRLAEEKAKNLATEKEIATQKRLDREAAIDETREKNKAEELEKRKNEALQKANQELRAAEAEKKEAAKYEADKKAKELQIAEKAEAKAKLEAQKAADEAAVIKYHLNDLIATKEQYESLIQDNETLRAELKELIEANKPEMSVKDLVNLEDASDGKEVSGEEWLAQGEAALKKAEAEFKQREEARRAFVKANTLDKIEKLLKESVKNGEIIDAEFYLKIIKGVK